MRSLLFLSFVGCTTLGCTVDQLPPAAPPARELPPQEEPLPTESSGLSRVVITTDVPARVERYTHVESITVGHRRGQAIGRELLCAKTPCTVSLRYGDHELIFIGLEDRGREGTAHIEVRRATTVINHALGQSRVHPGRPLGGLIVFAGALTLLVAGAVAMKAQKEHEPIPGAAGQAALAGLGTMIVGGVVIAVTPTKVQESATTQWTPTPPITGATVTAGVRF